MAIEGRPVLAVPCRRDRRLSEALRLRVPGDVPPRPGGLLGLELEFSVRSAQGGLVHFGSLIHRLALDGITLDPGDPNAYRCSWGGVITSDGAEAQIATPPVRTQPGFTARLQEWREPEKLNCASQGGAGVPPSAFNLPGLPVISAPGTCGGEYQTEGILAPCRTRGGGQHRARGARTGKG